LSKRRSRRDEECQQGNGNETNRCGHRGDQIPP
jgi:hypothetical protein